MPGWSVTCQVKPSEYLGVPFKVQLQGFIIKFKGFKTCTNTTNIESHEWPIQMTEREVTSLQV